jgi:hypothetical protein
MEDNGMKIDRGQVALDLSELHSLLVNGYAFSNNNV